MSAYISIAFILTLIFSHSGITNDQKNLDGETATIWATDSFQSLKINGLPGRRGKNGRDGNDASSCSAESKIKSIWHLNSDYHGRQNRFRLKSGSRGTDGGVGQTGGKGGDIYVYFQSINKLKNIFVESFGGDGGAGGIGGYGGKGCKCNGSEYDYYKCEKTYRCNETTSETLQYCETRDFCSHPNFCELAIEHNSGDCLRRRFRCSNGSKGKKGNTGKHGAAGSRGILHIIDRQEMLQDEVLSKVVKLEKDSLDIGFKFRERVWDEKMGASSLLAQSSIISDHYKVFKKENISTINIVWNSSKDIDLFKESSITIIFKNNDFTVQTDDDLLIDYEISNINSQHTLKITNAFKIDQLKKIEYKSISGSKSNLKLNLSAEIVSISDKLVKTSFSVELYYKKRFGGWSYYDFVNVSSEHVTVGPNGYVIDIGSMGYKKRHTKRGRKVAFNIYVGREVFGKKVEMIFMTPDLKI